MRLYLLVIFVFVLVGTLLLSKEADAQVPPSGFSNSIPFDCNSSQVDTDLYNFPVRLVLGGSVGVTNEDLTLVFDEIGNSYLKIAVTTELGTQCYTEVAYWSSGSESAEVWFKAPYLSSSLDTRFYFHYDATASNNTSYVGVPGSPVAQNIWDSDYVSVYHLNESSLGVNIRGFLDSTSNSYDAYNPGTSSTVPSRNMFTSSRKEGYGSGFSQYVSGTRTSIIFPFTLDMGTYTIEAVVSTGTFPTTDTAFLGVFDMPAFDYITLFADDRVNPLLGDIGITHRTQLFPAVLESYECRFSSDCAWDKSSWTSFSFVRGEEVTPGENLRYYKDGSLVVTGSYTKEGNPGVFSGYDYGWALNPEAYWLNNPDSIWISLDEFRLSTTDRGSSWLKASASTFSDSFVEWFEKPSVDTISASLQDDLYILGEVEVLDIAGSSIVKHGFVYSFVGTPTTSSGSSISSIVKSSPFSFSWNFDISGGTSYGNAFIRGFATNAYTTGYGDVLTVGVVPSLTVGTIVLNLDFEPEESSSYLVDDLSVFSNDMYYTWFDYSSSCSSGSITTVEDPIGDNTDYRRGNLGPTVGGQVFDPLGPPMAMYQEGEGEELPLFELFGWTSTYLEWGTGMLYMLAMMMTATALGLGGLMATKSPAIGALVCGFVLAGGLSTGVVPLWLLISYGLFCVSFLVAAKAV